MNFETGLTMSINQFCYLLSSVNAHLLSDFVFDAKVEIFFFFVIRYTKIKCSSFDSNLKCLYFSIAKWKIQLKEKERHEFIGKCVI